MVCATPRIAPTKAYLLFEAQPANNRGYSPNLKRTKKIKPEYSIFKGLLRLGAKLQTSKIKKMAVMGAAKYSQRLPEVGLKLSFTKSLTASAKG